MPFFKWDIHYNFEPNSVLCWKQEMGKGAEDFSMRLAATLGLRKVIYCFLLLDHRGLFSFSSILGSVTESRYLRNATVKRTVEDASPGASSKSTVNSNATDASKERLLWRFHKAQGKMGTSCLTQVCFYMDLKDEELQYSLGGYFLLLPVSFSINMWIKRTR